ncbi:DUF397 domain-containing protein [Streptomyces gamaensis]|uniref:DUF397 domain-containing protein n=1 Tax=Streptomyces gamaensis TaxID=1763542 RepID=A0ABW0YX12_9ACTN
MSAQRDLPIAEWRKSTYSGGGGGCIEVPVDKVPRIMPVRDSKDPGRGLLVFGDTAWSCFVTAVIAGNGNLGA